MLKVLGMLADVAPNQASSLAPTPIPAGCPWHDLSQLGLPNVNWCETTLCTYVNEPANAWSNLAYVLGALWVFFVTRRSDAVQRTGPLRLFAPTLAMVGVCSFAYHATNTHVTQVLDFFGMYLFCYLLLLCNFVRLGWLEPDKFLSRLWLAVLGTTAATAVLVKLHFPIQSIVGLLTLALIGTEAHQYRRQRRVSVTGTAQSKSAPPYHLRAFFASLGLLLAGGVASALDVTRTLCDPDNHVVQGHAVWHVLTAASLVVAFYHYRQAR